MDKCRPGEKILVMDKRWHSLTSRRQALAGKPKPSPQGEGFKCRKIYRQSANMEPASMRASGDK
jgi:hypothetical protein